MLTTRARLAWLGLVVAGICVAIACGSDDDGNGVGPNGADGGSSSSSSGSSSSGAGSSSGSTSSSSGGTGDGGDAASPSMAFLYVGAWYSGPPTYLVLGFKWSSDGSLVPIDMDPVEAGVQGASTGGGAYSVAASPSGKYVYNAYFGGIAAFSVDQTTGVLTRISAGGDGGSGDIVGGDFVATDPKGRLLYSTAGAMLRAFTIDDSTGKLTLAREVSTVNQGVAINRIAWIAVDVEARFLVVGGDGVLAVHRLDPITGLPILADGGVGGGTQYGGIGGSNFGGGESIDPSGLAIYHPTSGSLPAYAVDPVTLDLTAKGGGTPSKGVVAFESVPHPSGAIFGAGGGIAGYLADGGVVLTQVSGATGPINCSAITIAPSGTHLYAMCSSEIFTADIDGKSGSVKLRDGGLPTAGGGAGITRSFAWIPR